MHLKEKVRQIIHNYFSFVLPIPSFIVNYDDDIFVLLFGIDTFTWGRSTSGSPWFITTGRSDLLSNS